MNRLRALNAAVAVSACLSILGCATGRWADDSRADGPTASTHAGDDAPSFGGPFGGLFGEGRGEDGAAQSDIASAAKKDPFPNAAEALGY